MSTLTSTVPTQPRHQRSSVVRRDAWHLIGVGAMLSLLTFIAIIFIAPLLLMLTYSVKSNQQLAEGNGTFLLPLSDKTIEYQGKQLNLYNVPLNGTIRVLALKSSTRSNSIFLDPANFDAPEITVPVRAATLTKVQTFDPHLDVFSQAASPDEMDYPRALLNTLAITLISAVGAVSSAAFVAYGFSRFRFPGNNLLFMLVMATIILPPQVTIIPLFVAFQKFHLTGTIVPLILPHFFSNAYNVFLLRQYFMGIPLEMDEAAKVDGANPLQTFWHVVLPQAQAALVTVTLFHILASWGEFYNALIFTSGARESQPLSVVLLRFQQTYTSQPNQLMAGALLTIIIPVIIFFLAQRQLMQGVVITGVDK